MPPPRGRQQDGPKPGGQPLGGPWASRVGAVWEGLVLLNQVAAETSSETKGPARVPPTVSELPPAQWMSTQVAGQSTGYRQSSLACPGACLGVPTGSSDPLLPHLGCRGQSWAREGPNLPTVSWGFSSRKRRDAACLRGSSCSSCLDWAPPGIKQQVLMAGVCTG